MNADGWPTILVLDDEELLRESLALYLQSHGFEVWEAGSGEAALTVLAQYPCDAAVVDIRLPGMTGLDFIARAHNAWPAMRFIIYSGSRSIRLNPEIEAAGLTTRDILAKPAPDLDIIAAALRRVLGETECPP